MPAKEHVVCTVEYAAGGMQHVRKWTYGARVLACVT